MAFPAGIKEQSSVKLTPSTPKVGLKRSLKFSKGQRVKITKGEYEGEYCLIDEIDEHAEMPYELDNGEEVNDDMLVAAPLLYKVGDLMQVTIGGNRSMKIIEIDKEDPEMPYKLEDGEWYEEEDLKKAPSIAIKPEVITMTGTIVANIVSPAKIAPAEVKLTPAGSVKLTPAKQAATPVIVESPFKVGDFVKGKKDAPYGITNHNLLKGKVIKVSDDGKLTIDIVEHTNSSRRGMRFPGLNPLYFEKLSTSTEVKPGIKAIPAGISLCKVVESKETTLEKIMESVAPLKPIQDPRGIQQPIQVKVDGRKLSEVVSAGLPNGIATHAAGRSMANPYQPAVRLTPSVEPIRLKLADEPLIVASDIESKKERKSDRIMKSLKNILGTGSFGKDTSGRFAVSALGMAVKNNEGKFVVYKDGGLVDVMDLVFDVDGAFFRMPVTEVQAGDVIINAGVPVIIVDKDETGTTVVNPLNGREERLVPTSNILGLKFYTKVVNLVGNMFGGAADPANPMANMLPLMLLSGDGDFDMESMLPLMMMGQMNGGAAAGANPMANLLPLMMLSGDGDNKMEDLLMLQMLGGGGLNLFGGNQGR